jgi:hypothetical protein
MRSGSPPARTPRRHLGEPVLGAPGNRDHAFRSLVLTLIASLVWGTHQRTVCAPCLVAARARLCGGHPVPNNAWALFIADVHAARCAGRPGDDGRANSRDHPARQLGGVTPQTADWRSAMPRPAHVVRTGSADVDVLVVVVANSRACVRVALLGAMMGGSDCGLQRPQFGACSGCTRAPVRGPRPLGLR